MIGSFLNRLTGLLLPKRKVPASTYWEQRAETYGNRAVLNLVHPPEAYDSITRKQKEEIFPLLAKSLNGSERILLDFGCGPGRFTADLAQMISGKAIGIDPVRKFIEEARTRSLQAEVEYHVTQETGIPLPDHSVDVVWVCLVLGGLQGALLASAVLEIERVLRPGGLLFLIENTSEMKGHAHWTFRSAEDYLALFPKVTLQDGHSYDDLGQRISIIAGRKLS